MTTVRSSAERWRGRAVWRAVVHGWRRDDPSYMAEALLDFALTRLRLPLDYGTFEVRDDWCMRFTALLRDGTIAVFSGERTWAYEKRPSRGYWPIARKILAAVCIVYMNGEPWDPTTTTPLCVPEVYIWSWNCGWRKLGRGNPHKRMAGSQAAAHACRCGCKCVPQLTFHGGVPTCDKAIEAEGRFLDWLGGRAAADHNSYEWFKQDPRVAGVNYMKFVEEAGGWRIV